jgi:uncharacterized membrane protein YvbJ
MTYAQLKKAFPSTSFYIRKTIFGTSLFMKKTQATVTTNYKGGTFTAKGRTKNDAAAKVYEQIQAAIEAADNDQPTGKMTIVDDGGDNE